MAEPDNSYIHPPIDIGAAKSADGALPEAFTGKIAGAAGELGRGKLAISSLST